MNNRKVYNLGGINSNDHCWLYNVQKEFLFETKKLDIVIFPGGPDVNPVMYGENIGKHTHTAPYLDEKQKKMFDEIQSHNNKLGTKKVLCIGICRGAQLLTVLSGGRLIQHVSNHTMDGGKNEIMTNDFKISIQGDHHQMMYPYDMEDDEYEILGWSKENYSNTYLDGNDCEILGMRARKEPEIVYYPKTHSLCIQAHPEWGHLEYEASKYLNLLVNDIIADKKPKNLVIV